MAKFIYKGKIDTQQSSIRVKLFLIHFQDENKVHFVYSPHLDLTGYGHTFGDAKKSFEITLEEFIDYTVNKKTFEKVLTSLGWEINGQAPDLTKVLAPSITRVINENDYVSEIFDKYAVNTFHHEVGLPVLQ